MADIRWHGGCVPAWWRHQQAPCTEVRMDLFKFTCSTQVAFPEIMIWSTIKTSCKPICRIKTHTGMSLLSKHFCWLGWAGLGWAGLRWAGLGYGLAGVMLTDIISRAAAGAGSYFPPVQTFKIANLHTNNQQLSEPRGYFHAFVISCDLARQDTIAGLVTISCDIHREGLLGLLAASPCWKRIWY